VGRSPRRQRPSPKAAPPEEKIISEHGRRDVEARSVVTVVAYALRRRADRSSRCRRPAASRASRRQQGAPRRPRGLPAGPSGRYRPASAATYRREPERQQQRQVRGPPAAAAALGARHRASTCPSSSRACDEPGSRRPATSAGCRAARVGHCGASSRSALIVQMCAGSWRRRVREEIRGRPETRTARKSWLPACNLRTRRSRMQSGDGPEPAAGAASSRSEDDRAPFGDQSALPPVQAARA